MPKYYCDYCDIYLTHDSASVRKAHNEGWKHRLHVKNYFADFFRANNIPFREDHEHWRRARDREREMRGEPPLSRRPEPVPVRFGAPPGGLPILTGANLPEDGKSSGLPSLGFFGPPPTGPAAPPAGMPQFAQPTLSAPPQQAPQQQESAPNPALPAPSMDQVEAELEMVRRRRAMMG